MSEHTIKSMLEFIVPRLIAAIMTHKNLSEEEALARLYSSNLYRQLENAETALWHLSVPTLYALWLEEQETGTITYPEEG